MAEFCEIQQLVKLFNPPRDNSSDSDNDNFEEATGYGSPEKWTNQEHQEKPKEKKKNPYSKIVSPKKENEVADLSGDTLSAETDYASEWKKTPKWNISYRQKVTASDVFLQIGAKTPATASCEDMIVTIHLPGEHMQNIDIKIFKDNLQVNASNFTLKIPLPHPVHPQKGDAKWDREQENLILTLQMEREFDFVNF